VMGQSFASERLHGIATRLRVEGERGQARRMNKVIRGAAGPLVSAVRAEARRRLPHEGGLDEQQASQAIRVSITTGSRSAGVRIRTRTRGSVQTNKGFVRHPVFGTWRAKMPNQQIPGAAGWWTDTMTEGSAAVTPLILAEMNKVGRIIQGGY
jgi:hypothetical protein